MSNIDCGGLEELFEHALLGPYDVTMSTAKVVEAIIKLALMSDHLTVYLEQKIAGFITVGYTNSIGEKLVRRYLIDRGYEMLAAYFRDNYHLALRSGVWESKGIATFEGRNYLINIYAERQLRNITIYFKPSDFEINL